MSDVGGRRRRRNIPQVTTGALGVLLLCMRLRLKARYRRQPCLPASVNGVARGSCSICRFMPAVMQSFMAGYVSEAHADGCCHSDCPIGQRGAPGPSDCQPACAKDSEEMDFVRSRGQLSQEVNLAGSIADSISCRKICTGNAGLRSHQ